MFVPFEKFPMIFDFELVRFERNPRNLNKT